MERAGTKEQQIEPEDAADAKKAREFPTFVDLMRRLRPIIGKKPGTVEDIRLQESHFGETRKEPTDKT